MKKNKEVLCAIFNYAPHYRFPIYKEMEKEFLCDFYFGNKVNTEIKKIDYKELIGFQKELENFSCKYFLLRKGVWKLAFVKKYKNYLISWEPLNISLWIFLFLCKILGKNVYSWQHGISRKRISKKFILLEKFFLKLKSGTFLYGHTAQQNMINLGFNPKKLFVIYNSLDSIKNLELRSINRDEKLYENYFKNDAPVLLFIGRLTPVKKLQMLINVHHKLLKEGVFCNVVLVGDGSMKSELQSLVKEKNLEDRYWFVGALYDEKEISNYLYNADLCISPGNVGLTAVHALSYGLPVITNNNFETQMPEFESIIKGKTGSFFEEDNIDSLLYEIESWLHYSKTNRDKIRQDCYSVIDEKYNVKNQINILKKYIYHQ